MINQEERSYLLSYSRSILEKFYGVSDVVDDFKISDHVCLKKRYGVFATLYNSGKLRGCMGRLLSSDPLFETLKYCLINSATSDPRFPAVQTEELDSLNIEISILSELKLIKDIDEIIIGKHGIYIKNPAGNGTLLPQVAVEQNWSVKEFLGYCSRDKAGLSWDAWKLSEVYIYESLILKE